MKSVLLSLVAAGALTAAALPAAAQPWDGYRGHDRSDGYRQDYGGRRLTTAYVDSLEWKINNAAREGRISWGEARDLRAEFRQVQPLAWRVETGSARGWEVARLERAVNRIEGAVYGGYRDRY